MQTNSPTPSKQADPLHAESAARLRPTDSKRFDADVRSAPRVLLKFTGQWCGPCKALAPTLAAIAKERPTITVLELDADNCPEIAARFGVRVLPTLVLFADGGERARIIGNQRKSAILAVLDEHG
jgi:thioredoxin 1